MTHAPRDIIICLVALALPVFVIPVDDMPVRLSKELLVLWTGAAILICAVKNWWMRAFMALCLIHLIVHPAENSFWHMGLILSFSGIYLVVRQMAVRPLKWLLVLVCAIALVQALLVITQAAGIWRAGLNSWEHARGLSGRANDAGAFFVLSLPAFWIVGRGAPAGFVRAYIRIATVAVAAGIVLYALWLTRTTAPMAALFSGGLFWLCFYKISAKHKIAACVVAASAAAVFFIKYDSIFYTIREHPAPTAWAIAQKQAALKPLGYGLGSFKDLFPHMSRDSLSEMQKMPDGRWLQKEAWQQATNEYIQMRFELGWPFYVVVGGYFAAFIVCLIGAPPTGARLAAATGVVMLAVGCFGFFWMHLADAAFPGVMWMALWDRESAKVKAESL